MNEQFEKYNSIPKEKFTFASGIDTSHDKKLDTKPVGYMRDAFNRFRKNKSSVVAAIVILFLIIYALIGPLMMDSGYLDSYTTEVNIANYKELLPRLKIFDGTGFWDGSKKVDVNKSTLLQYEAMYIETGYNPVQKIIKSYTTQDVDGTVTEMYTIRINTYYSISCFKLTLAEDDYLALQQWQDENQIQVILPFCDNPVNNTTQSTNLNVWYACDKKGNAKLDSDGNFVAAYRTKGTDNYTSEMRLDGDPYNDGDTSGRWRYAYRTGKKETGYNYVVRVSPYNWFQYRYGFEPSFMFGTNSDGYDIFTRLASGARFSFLLALVVSMINLTVGAIYGAIEGYYGGIADMAMERFSDILSGVPFTVVTVLFQLHLADKVGVVGALIFSFILTGWIGMAGTVRMQFYRFKNQEYVLAARTLGAKDSRIIWKHIFPNTLGTIITGTILVIPGVIFSETSLSYLGIINLDSSTMSSVGTMLSVGQSSMTKAPHILFFPALFIALLEICFNLFGNGLRDAFNPSLRGSEE